MHISSNDWNLPPQRFEDRRAAGRQLGERLQAIAHERPIVIALPRGGVEVGYEVARTLDAPLDICVVRKVGVPWHTELGVGAVAEGGRTYIARGMLAALGLSEAELAETVHREQAEVAERVRLFREGRPRPDLFNRNILLVDDGVATGGTVRAAVASLRDQNPSRIVLAVPVAAPDTLVDLAPQLDGIVCLLCPTPLHAIGVWYDDFRQVTNEEVVRLLARRREEERSGARLPVTQAAASPP